MLKQVQHDDFDGVDEEYMVNVIFKDKKTVSILLIQRKGVDYEL